MERLPKIEQPQNSVLRTALVATLMAISTAMVLVRTRAQDVLDNAPQTAPQTQAKETAFIATLNTAWLSDKDNSGITKRIEADYEALSSVIASTRASIIALQEAKNEEAVNRLLKYLPKTFLCETRNTGQQDPAVIWDSSVAKVENVSLLTELNDANFKFARSPLLMDIFLGDLDGKMLVVHLKAADDRESKRRRKEEMKRINDWVVRYLQNPANDPDVFVVGDFNEVPTSDDFPNPLLRTFPTLGTLVKSDRTVDGLVRTPDTDEEFVKDSMEVMRDDATKKAYSEHVVSDHWAVRWKIWKNSGTADKRR